MEPFSFLLGLAQFAPAIVSLFTSDSTATKAATAVSTVARVVTGQDVSTPDGAKAAEDALRADPAKLMEYQRLLAEQAVQIYQAETARLQVVNETIRAEAASSDGYVRRMRPTFGYAMALTWLVQMLAASYVVAFRPAEAAGVLNGIASTTTLWGIGLAVLGVYVYKRSGEKGADSALLAPLAGRLPARSRS